MWQVTTEPVVVPAAAPSVGLAPAATSLSTPALAGAETSRGQDRVNSVKNFFAQLMAKKTVRAVCVPKLPRHWLNM